jgi:hypothetical protein
MIVFMTGTDLHVLKKEIRLYRYSQYLDLEAGSLSGSLFFFGTEIQKK